MANHAAIAVPAAKKRANPKTLSMPGRIRICANPQDQPPDNKSGKAEKLRLERSADVPSAVTMQVRTDGKMPGQSSAL